MKKIFAVIILLIVLNGCNIGTSVSTPKNEVEKYLDSYQKEDGNILNDLDTLVEDTSYSIEQKTKYKEILRHNYTNMSYEINSEDIDGDKAIVDTTIEVTDLSPIITMDVNKDEYVDEDGKYDESKYYDYQLDMFSKANEKTKYNIKFSLTLKDNTWVIDKIDLDTIRKIHGIYIS